MKTEAISFPKLHFILYFSILFFACNSELKLSEEDQNFVEIYARLMIISEIGTDSLLQKEMTGQILQDYNTNPEELQQSIQNYQDDPERWALILQRVRDRIKELRLEGVKSFGREARDTRKL